MLLSLKIIKQEFIHEQLTKEKDASVAIFKIHKTFSYSINNRLFYLLRVSAVLRPAEPFMSFIRNPHNHCGEKAEAVSGHSGCKHQEGDSVSAFL